MSCNYAYQSFRRVHYCGGSLLFNFAVKRAELKGVHFHDLRRTFGTLGAIDARIDEKAMQKLLGHASIETTMKHYVISTEEHEKEAM